MSRENRKRPEAASEEDEDMNSSLPFISVANVSFGEDEESLVLDVLRSGQVAQGPRVEQLERLFADAVGTEHAVAVSSGTAALFLALESIGIGPGDEVIT